MKKALYLLLFFQMISKYTSAQTDSLIFKNGNYMVGEIKTMNKNVVMVKTPFSDKDFNIKWNRVNEIYTETYFLISLSNGDRYNGTLTSTQPGKIVIITDDADSVETNLNDIVFLDDLDRGFWNQLSFSIDVGLNLTRANNFKQFNTGIKLGYTAKRWGLTGTYNTLFSQQNETEDIKRIDGGVGFRYFMPHDWYPLAALDFLSTTEQSLDLRSTLKAGMGKYVTHTNRIYWGFAAGINYNNEQFSTTDTPDRKSMEGFFGTELNMFNIGDLDLVTSIIAYPSFTEGGRWRADFQFDTKYEMWFDDDFYIKLSYSFNYDNRPAEGGSELDYVFNTGFGWEW
jgi:hypothetical protein